MRELPTERVWVFASGICLIAAVVLLAREQLNAAFVAAALGVVAWFLNVRTHLKRSIIPPDDEDELEDEADHEAEDESDEVKDVYENE